MILKTDKLFKHQYEAVEKVIANNGIGFLRHDPGLGKTRATLEIYKRLRSKARVKLIVFCPISLIKSAWLTDIHKFTGFSAQSLRDKKIEDADIYVVNYEWLYNSKNRMALQNKILSDEYLWMCALDESSKIKNFKAQITSFLLDLRNRFQYRLCLSATPAPNNASEYWPQIQFLGDIFSPGTKKSYFYAFQNRFFHLERAGQRVTGRVSPRDRSEYFKKGFKYTMTSERREEFYRLLEPYLHVAKKEKCLDLPETIDQIREIEIKGEQKRVYKELERSLVSKFRGQYVVAKVFLTKLIKLRQVVSGFFVDSEGELVELSENPKLGELKDTLEELGKRQAIIWCNFHKEIADVKALLGESAVTLYSQTKNKQESIDKFADGQVQYLIAHPKSAGHGLTFVNADTQIFYSLDYSWEAYFQARGRTHRIGQKKKCLYIHLLTNTKVDKAIFKILKTKGAAQELIDEFFG